MSPVLATWSVRVPHYGIFVSTAGNRETFLLHITVGRNGSGALAPVRPIDQA